MCLAVPGKIIEIYTLGAMRMAKVDFGGVLREACIEAVPDAQVGDYTIIHAGFALNLLSEEEARVTLEALDELASMVEEMDNNEDSERASG